MVLVRCRRCGREAIHSAETFEAEAWGERWVRSDLADDPFVDMSEIDPRILERRRP